jgi:hypothetical protein
VHALARPSSVLSLLTLFLCGSLGLAAAAQTLRASSPEEIRAAVQTAQARGADVAIDFDVPGQGDTVSGLVPLVGWAADLRAGGSGIEHDSVRVSLGTGNQQDEPSAAADLGVRSDVAAVLGLPRGMTQGYLVGWHTCTFPPGPYRVEAAAAAAGTTMSSTVSREVTVAPCPSAPDVPLLADPLDGSIPQWTVGRFRWCEFEYADGEYRVMTTAANPHGGCNDPDTARIIFADFRLDVDVRLVEPTAVAAANIPIRGVVRVPPEPGWSTFTAGYILQLRPVAGTVALLYDTGTTTTRIAEAPATGAHPGAATNHVTIVAQGSRIRVLLNGEPALDLADERHRWGWIGLGAGGRTGAQAAFRNLEVRRLPQ